MDPRDVLDRSTAGPDLVVRYGDHPDAVIDVFLPSSDGAGTAPLVVLLHGGYWRAEWDRVHLRPLAWGLVEAGFVVATPEYRRGPGSWPAMSHDVETALGAVRELVASAAPGRVDPAARLTLSGHSAGGHLALWSGLRAGPTMVERVVALAPVTDVRYAARAGLDDNAAQELLGGEPDEVPAAYADADVVRLLPGALPVTVIHGDADRHVPVEMNRELAASIGADSFRYVELADADHFALIDPTSAAWPTVLRELSTTR